MQFKGLALPLVAHDEVLGITEPLGQVIVAWF